MRATLALAAIGAMWAMPVHAAGPHVEGAIYLERRDPGERLIEPAAQLRSGDRVVLLVRWQAADDRDGFMVTTSVPPALAFQRDSSDEVEVSVDDGKNWSRIETLPSVSRNRITHLRWRIDARQAARGSGNLVYSALVR